MKRSMNDTEIRSNRTIMNTSQAQPTLNAPQLPTTTSSNTSSSPPLTTTTPKTARQVLLAIELRIVHIIYTYIYISHRRTVTTR